MAGEADQDVAPESSPGSDALPESPAADSSAVTDVAAPPDDRPIQNIQAEFNRKFTKVERQLAEVAALLAAQQAPRPAPEPVATQAYTDQQLLELANAGNAAALQELIQRTTARQVGAQTQQREQQAAILAQLQALYGRYPMLTDAAHPLTQAAMQAKTLLLRTGYPPQSPATDLEAIKLAIVDNPGLAHAQHATATPTGARGPTAPQQGVEGAAPRRASPTAITPGRALSQREKDIAGRMGIKDPAAALKRFQERQQSGRSSVSPLVAQIVREESAP